MVAGSRSSRTDLASAGAFMISNDDRAEGALPAANPKPIRLMIADDQRLVRQGLRAMLDRPPAMDVVAEAGTAAEAVAQYGRHRPDVLLMDLRFPDGCGVDVIRAVR